MGESPTVCTAPKIGKLVYNYNNSVFMWDVYVILYTYKKVIDS